MAGYTLEVALAISRHIHLPTESKRVDNDSEATESEGGFPAQREDLACWLINASGQCCGPCTLDLHGPLGMAS